MKHPISLILALILASTNVAAQTAVGTDWTYQGYLNISGATVDEPADFIFTLHDAATLGNSVGSPILLYGVDVVDGVFDATLDFGSGIFDGNNRWLEISVRVPAGAGGYLVLSPRQKITAVPYALHALNGGGGGGGLWTQSGLAITNSNTGDFVGINRTSPVTGNEYFGIQAPVGDGVYGGMYIRTDSGTGLPFYGYHTGTRSAWTYLDGATGSWHLNNVGTRLTVTNNGNVGIGNVAPGYKLSVAGTIESTTGGFRFPDGTIQTSAATGGGGGNDGDWTINGDDMYMTPADQLMIGTATPATGAKLSIYDANRSGQTLVDVNSNLLGKLQLRTSQANLSISAIADEGQITTGTSQDLSIAAGRDLFLKAADDLYLRTAGARWAQIDANGLTQFFHSNNTATVAIDGQDPSSGGGQIELFKSNGTRTVLINGATGSGTQGGSVAVYTDGNPGTATAVMDGEYGGTAGGALVLRNSSGQTGIELVADLTPNEQAEIWMYKPNGIKTIEIEAEETGDPTQGSALKLYNDTGQLTIELDADHGSSNQGRVITGVLEITGGSDLSEQFDVDGGSASIEPGSVVSIDPDSPGDLSVSETAYDRRVAGIISGAGGVTPGMLMGQRGSEADGKHPVALTGRVYCKVDASYGAIEPGDLLTTSDTPGHAMKVTDHNRAMGAILGKAMSSLDSGRGEVLVLVSLQ